MYALFFVLLTLLGGRFDPEKKYLGPPPQIPQFAADTLLAPQPLPLETPPPGIFNRNRPPRLLAARAPPLPPPLAEKNKKYPKRPPSLSLFYLFHFHFSIYRERKMRTNFFFTRTF